MDFVNKFTGGENTNASTAAPQQGSNAGSNSSGGGLLGGIGDKFNNAAGGGRESEKNEDMLDKGSPAIPSSFAYNSSMTTPRSNSPD